MEPVKLAMIGCGENAKKSIVKSVNASTAVRFVAAMDIKLDLAQDLAAEAGAAMATDSYEAVLDNPEVEAVVISTPHSLHVPMGIQADHAHLAFSHLGNRFGDGERRTG